MAHKIYLFTFYALSEGNRSQIYESSYLFLKGDFVAEQANIMEGLKAKAVEIRKHILTMTNAAGSGHPGGSLSAVEILVALYFSKLHHNPSQPQWEDRDRLIISKGHASPVVYAVLAEAGYFPKEELATFRKLGTRLQGHVHRKVPGVELNTGSLGQGLSVANGMAIAARLKAKKHKVYCLLGDGEIQEGSVWEAAMSAAHYKLNNVCAIVDYNKVQENGLVKEIMNLEPLVEKWKSFGWDIVEVDGHNLEELMHAFDQFSSATKPYAVIAHTVKGKGVSFMEGACKWHGKAPNKDEMNAALKELLEGKVA